MGDSLLQAPIDNLRSGSGRPSAHAWARVAAALCAALLAPAFGGQIEYQDALERAIDPPGDLNLTLDNFWDIYAGYHYSYDSNVFRLNDSISSADVKTLIGPQATKSDSMNSYTAGGNMQWQIDKQTLVVDLRADDNQFVDNTQLNNVSTQDRVLLNWGVGPQLSGQVGVDYQRQLASFVNATFYVRDIQQVTDYFGGGRYQMGPHWAVFAGFLGTETKLSAAQFTGDDSNRKGGQGGVEYYSDALDSFGADFRYTTANYPNVVFASGDQLYPSYSEDRARLFVRYTFTDKTNIDVAGGWLHRSYDTHEVGDFSGVTFRGQLQWLPTDKTVVVAQGWRELHAFLTTDSDYFVSTGVSVGPRWSPTDKIAVGAFVDYEKQDYANSSFALTSLAGGPRHDRLTYGTLTFSYTPIRLVSIDALVRHEHRGSNSEAFTYTDTLFTLGVTVKYTRP